MNTRFAVAVLLLSTSSFLRSQEDPLHPAKSSSPSAESSASPATTASASPASSAAASSPVPNAAPPQLTEALLKNLKARWIGPAVMGGRVSDIALDPKNPFVFYVGLAHGGLFKTGNNGVSFDPIFDKQPVLSIGAVAVAPSDSDVVWVGTGEANDRNSSGWGDGVYRSTDGGDTWQNVGLKESRAIGRIVVDPRKPEVAYVAASGHLWVDGGERGLFKTTDAGKTWKLVLQAPAPHNARTGSCDVALDPIESGDCLRGALSRDNGPHGVLLRDQTSPAAKMLAESSRARTAGLRGKNWLTDCLRRRDESDFRCRPAIPRSSWPSCKASRGAPAISTSCAVAAGEFFDRKMAANIGPARVRSTRGRFILARSGSIRLTISAFTASGSRYSFPMMAGKNFREDLSEKIHPDCHAMAIQAGSAPPPKPAKPEDKNKPPKPPVSQRVLLGTDGGVYQSFAAGKGWDHLSKIAAGEFYRLTLDDTKPHFRIAGGLQDNENWVGPSGVPSKEEIRNSDWTSLAGGDGFYVVFDPTDHDTFYAESQGGEVHRINLRNGELRQLRPEPPEGQPRYRFHWNSPLMGSIHKPGVIYLAGNHVFRLTDRAEKYSVISPDLTRNDPAKTNATGSGAENYGVVYSLAESPKRAGLLWAGTDDGRLWITENDGGKWAELTDNLPEPARNAWIVRIEASPHDPNVAYVVTNSYRGGDDRPSILRTADLGKTWQSVAGDLPPNDPVEVVRQDPVNPKLLYAGTHFGLFASFDEGSHWVRIAGIPAVRVDDVQIHPRTSDLVIGTHGRSIAILDDSVALRQLTTENTAKAAWLFPVRPVTGAYLQPGYADWNGKGIYRGSNPPDGAIFNVWVREFTGDEIKIAITKASGQPVANLKAPGAPGLTRLTWDLRPTKDVTIEYGGDDPKRLLPAGDYNADLSFGDVKVKQAFHVDLAEGITPR